jgi:DNA-binding HxlR family transcriptional regulator|tara:strand:+ start:115 stop:465 length:351 start_codon:yes stop_codon:yes gene_type:complete
MILFHKRTFKDFSESDEAIATNILSTRLKMLMEYEIIRKEKLPDNKQKNLYILTERGLNLTPVIVNLMLWSDKNIRTFHATLTPSAGPLERMQEDKEGFITMLMENYKEKNWLPTL